MTTITLPTDPNGTTIEADPNLPVITIVRDFAAPAERVYRAWTDPELVVQWMGPNEIEMKIDRLGRQRPAGTTATRRGRAARRSPRSTAPSTRLDPANGWCRPSPGKECPTGSAWRR